MQQYNESCSESDKGCRDKAREGDGVFQISLLLLLLDMWSGWNNSVWGPVKEVRFDKNCHPWSPSQDRGPREALSLPSPLLLSLCSGTHRPTVLTVPVGEVAVRPRGSL